MKRFFLFAAAAVCMVLAGCNGQQGHTPSSVAQVSEPVDTVVPVVEVPFNEKLLTAADVTLTKDLLYDTYTLEDTYPYKDTRAFFQMGCNPQLSGLYREYAAGQCEVGGIAEL